MNSVDYQIVKITEANRLLAECRTVRETKKIIDIAVALEVYAKRAKLSQETVQKATELKFEAERKLGSMLKNTKRAKGAAEKRCAPEEGRLPTLSELGITYKESIRTQMIADIPEKMFQDIKAGKKTVVQIKRELIKGKVKTTEFPKDKYRIVYADPPWQYGNGIIGDSYNYGHVERHYPTMSIKELCALEIKNIISENAVLFLWVTSPLLPECFPVINAWGFEYKASFVWDKIKHNFGHYNSVRHEFLLICTRGSCLPDNNKLEDSVISIERSKTHSEKPEYFRELIDRLYPNGKRIELFARKQIKGWDVWGNQIITNTIKKN